MEDKPLRPVVRIKPFRCDRSDFCLRERPVPDTGEDDITVALSSCPVVSAKADAEP
jgi:hypothetical protein